MSRTRLYELRSAFLCDKSAFSPHASGGDHLQDWPASVATFLKEFLPLQTPPNYQLVADEIERRCEFKRSRSAIERYVKSHYAHLVPHPERKPRIYRRFRRAKIGELYQHDSSIHQWWPAPAKQILLLTVDDCSGYNVAGRFVSAETSWNHFKHFRFMFETYGLPDAIYTDGLSLFGPSSSSDHCDPKSQFQRALLGLGVAHLVAPTPQAKGKIERRFRTFQGRIITLLAHAKVATWEHADEILQMDIHRLNRTIQRSTGKVPLEVWENGQLANNGNLRPIPNSRLLDLHFSIRCQRMVNKDSTIDFEGKNYEIAPTARKSVTVVSHPNQKFWVVEGAIKNIWPRILGEFTL